jgi:hypothetical protein
MTISKIRDSMIDRAATAFAKDKLDEAAFESLVARIQTAAGEAELIALADTFSPILGETMIEPSIPDPSVPEVREIGLDMSNVKKSGDWVDARAYRLDGKMSNFELDYRAYADREEFEMTLSVDLSMSNLRLIVPPDWQVDCRIDRNSASNIKDRGALSTKASSATGSAQNNKRILIEGNLSMSNIIVRRRGEKRGLFAFLFGR